jgi:hypothetical protein
MSLKTRLNGTTGWSPPHPGGDGWKHMRLCAPRDFSGVVCVCSARVVGAPLGMRVTFGTAGCARARRRTGPRDGGLGPGTIAVRAWEEALEMARPRHRWLTRPRFPAGTTQDGKRGRQEIAYPHEHINSARVAIGFSVVFSCGAAIRLAVVFSSNPASRLRFPTEVVSGALVRDGIVARRGFQFGFYD